jgi:polyhydroxyalkanoate synthase subunit PhaC
MTEKETISTKGQTNSSLFLDQVMHAWINQYFGVSSIAYFLAIYDWLMHLAVSPGTQAQLMLSAYQKLINLDNQEPDRRFKSELWQESPFNWYVKNFLFYEQFWHEAVKVRGVTKHHQLMNKFMMQQLLNLMAPTNFIGTNPEVLAVTKEQQGMNFIKGFNNFFEDFFNQDNSKEEDKNNNEKFQVGKDLATTPGKVIYKNDLIELIQYSPSTSEVYANPVLIVPACIMKYYILDLSAHNSLVKYLVSEGHTVFMISWKNPEYIDRKLVINDYINLGVLAAINVVSDIVPNMLINAVGYCIGGTLLMIAAAYLAGKNNGSLKSVTLFAAQIDFTYAGEILAFVDESQVSMLEDVMSQQGYLDGKQMASAFAVMHSHDLMWGKYIKNYWLGEKSSVFDIMAWNADATRLPDAMHSEYLENLFLNNALIQGDLVVNKEGISLLNINVPIFAVSTATDHVAPWKSVYKVHFFTKTDLTFLLTTGGHNVGIVSEPGHAGRSYQVMARKKKDNSIAADLWKKTAPSYEGSWWPEWQRWLVPFSGEKIQPPEFGNKEKGYSVLYDAPGIYVLKK